MANKITIDIVAETQKLTSGINDANSQIDGMSGKLKGAASAAAAAASAFVLKQGVTFLKQGIDEAKEAAETMRAATTTFGEGSAALQKITKDAEKFGKELAVDNDELIQLATQLGSRLPVEAQALSVELVKTFKDIEAFTGGAVSAEAAGSRLAKAFADGKLTAKELQKIFPGLEAATYDQAEALSEAGKTQEALNLLVDAGAKKYGDAAANNVTASQKLDVALADLKEQIGAKLLPVVLSITENLVKLIETFSNLPGPVQNVILAILGIIGIGGPILSFLASMKTAMVTLGIVSATTTGTLSATTIALNFLKVALAGLGIGLVIAAIVLLVQNWDSVTEAVGKVWEKIKEVIPKAWNKVMEFKDKVVDFVKDIIDAYLSIPRKMAEVGSDIVRGLWNGMQSMVGWLREKVTGFFKNLIPDWAEKALGIKSPSKVFAGIGKNIVQGLASTFNVGNVAKAVTTATPTVPRITSPNTIRTQIPTLTPPINITINAGLGTDPAKLGREVSKAVKQYGKVSNKAVIGGGGGRFTTVAL